MPSPFPGMDPYLEDPAFWRDFHGEFIYACRHLLLDRLPPDYDAAVEEQVRLVEVSPEELVARREKDALPDVAVIRNAPPCAFAAAATAGAVATLEPVVIEVEAEREERERWIEIIHRPDRSLVTVIELLSPTNKNSDGYGDYRAKRGALLRQRINLVELDLLLGGRRMEDPNRMPAGDFFAVVRRQETPDRRFAYGWALRHPLPTIPVPLRPPDADVPLDLSAAFAIAYDRGRYARRLRYEAAPAAPIPLAERPWAEGLARSAR